MERVFCLALGYVFGLFQTGYLYGRAHGIDIRSQGSGNSGTTNALRVMGKKAGLIVFAGDFFKTLIPCLLVRFFVGDGELYTHLLVLYTGFGVTLGHNFPFYLKFKGGKGIAAMAGLLAASDMRIALICLAVFIVTVVVTRYVSLGSLFVAALFFILTVYFTISGSYGTAGGVDMSEMALMNTGQIRIECCVAAGVISCMAFWRHRANIGRLIHGTENKLGAKKA